jgi:hypothetical protein
MEHWGKTAAGTPRFFCAFCKVSDTRDRDDVEKRHSLHQLEKWLGGKDSLTKLASEEHKTRQALWKELHPLFEGRINEPVIPPHTKVRILILDATYIHGHTLCALVAIDENDKLYWRFAPYESYKVWCEFLSHFSEPEIVVMDGQKGLFAAARTLWPHVPVQRCQFHVISFAIQYLGRKPKEQVGKDLINILYSLKDAKTLEGKDVWLRSYIAWERKYDFLISARDRTGHFMHPRLRSTRLIMRKALPYLFTFLNHPGAPNTTNLVEGWVNGAVAEALRFHRGLRVHEKKALVSIVLSNLRRQKPKNVIQKDLI